MRKSDKKLNMQKVNILTEQRQNASRSIVKENVITEDNYSDLFNFLEQDPRKMTGANAGYTSPVKMNKTFINPDTGQKEPNPMYGKIFKNQRYRFRWEDTYSKSVSRTNPEHEMGQRSGTYEKIQGYDMLEQGKSGLYLPIVPTNVDEANQTAVFGYSEDDGKTQKPISKEEFRKYLPPKTEYKPSASGSEFRPLILDRTSFIKAGGNVWSNPNTKVSYIGPKAE